MRGRADGRVPGAHADSGHSRGVGVLGTDDGYAERVGIVILFAVVAVGVATTVYLRRQIVAQTEDLRAAVAQLGTDVGEAIARVEAKISSLGEPDPDLTADIAAIKDASARLDRLAEEPAPPAGGDTGTGGGTDTGGGTPTP